MYLIYNCVYFVFVLMYFPYLLLNGKWHHGMWQRSGHFSGVFEQKLKSMSSQGTDVIWIHAVSVGEILTVVDLIRRLENEFPNQPLVCSTVTPTGYKVAGEKLPSTVQIIYAPLDISWIVRKFVRLISPKLYISTETEIWPNMYTYLYKQGVPVFIINGRISDKSFHRYQRFSWFIKPVLKCVTCFCMQSELDAERIIQLGAVTDHVSVVGNLKFDIVAVESSQQNSLLLKYCKDKAVFVAGSTHQGEEILLLRIYKRLLSEFPGLCFILCPRHIERVDSVIEQVRNCGFIPTRFSELGQEQVPSGVSSFKGSHQQHDVIVVDTIGQLRSIYQLGTVIFVGKTFTVGGGQNMIEPAALGKPVIVGPLTQNFRDVMRQFLDAGAMAQVQDINVLYTTIKDWLFDERKASLVGKVARDVVALHRGATDRTLEHIRVCLKT